MNKDCFLRQNFDKKTAIVYFCAIAVAWLAIDRVTKLVAETNVLGQVFRNNVFGLFEFKLAHNTGAAWSIFSNSTLALGVFSLVVCALLLAYLFVYKKGSANLLELCGSALVFAGGIGNAIDRFAFGYVVDLINTTFMSFPIFNVADIGVTCGVVLFLAGTFISLSESENKESEDNPNDA
ncbi:MAG: signal peptidase II [Eggerthellaceae bacterium]|nr:signal peptidase II [Eggerthellaceae bacterium]